MGEDRGKRRNREKGEVVHILRYSLLLIMSFPSYPIYLLPLFTLSHLFSSPPSFSLCSTESGVPDYRSPNGSYSKGHKPTTYQEFVSKLSTRKRYPVYFFLFSFYILSYLI